ncbi:MAG: hypothetical protein ACUVXG_06900 [Anaerolineae bacterium]
MRRPNSSVWCALACVLVFVLIVLTACGGGKATPVTPQAEAVGTVAPPPTKAAAEVAKPTEAPTPKPPTQAAPTPVAPPTPTPVPPPTVEAIPTLESDAFGKWWGSLEEEITTFRGRTTMRDAKGMDFTIDMESVKEPPASRVVMVGKDESGFTGLEMVQVEGAIYMRFKEKETDEWQEWTSFASGETADQMSPEEMFMGPFMGLQQWDARELQVVDRHETVNGVDCTHYQVSDKAMAEFIRLTTEPGKELEPGELQVTQAQADFWVANKGEYLVEAAVRIEGTQDNQPYWMEITTEVLEVNKPFTIEPPAGAAKPGLPDDVPVFPGATMTASGMGITTFEVKATVKEVADFYKAQMPTNGWTAKGEPLEMENMAMLGFTKDGRSCQVMISAEGEKVTLTISISAE